MRLDTRIKKLEQLTRFCRCDKPESSIKSIELTNELSEFFDDLPKNQAVPKTDVCLFCDKPFDQSALVKLEEVERVFVEKLERLLVAENGASA